jgi:hypothetical protein
VANISGAELPINGLYAGSLRTLEDLSECVKQVGERGAFSQSDIVDLVDSVGVACDSGQQICLDDV